MVIGIRVVVLGHILADELSLKFIVCQLTPIDVGRTGVSARFLVQTTVWLLNDDSIGDLLKDFEPVNDVFVD